MTEQAHGVAYGHSPEESEPATGSGQRRTPAPARPRAGELTEPVLGAHGAVSPPGLVPSQTSGTPFVIDPVVSRLNRMKRGTLTSARLHQEQATKGGFRFKAAMLTLTYRPDVTWTPRHVADLLRHVRQWCRRRSIECRYVWVLELTKAGRPHYHIVFWLPRGVSLPKPDKQGWWMYGFTKIEWARNPVGYVAKYASKGDSDAKFPKSARIHGSGGLSAAARNERAWWLSPGWVRDRFPLPSMRPRRAVGGGWVCLETGEHVSSPYRVVFDRGRVLVYFEGIPDG